MAPAGHSDLEVVPNSEFSGAEATAPGQKYPYYSQPQEAPISLNTDSDTHKIQYETGASGHERSGTICGLKKKIFWIAVVVAVVVVAAAVGGGVGGALSSKKSNNSDPTPARSSGQPLGENSASIAPTPTSSQSSTVISTTELVGPSSTIQRDCPSSNNSIYDVSLGSTVMSFRKFCNLSLLNANGIDNVIGKVTNNINDCINLCAAYNINNKTQIQQGTNRICNAVCWRNTFDKANDWPGGMCFAYTTQNSSNTFRFKQPAEVICDGAGLINQAF